MTKLEKIKKNMKKKFRVISKNIQKKSIENKLMKEKNLQKKSKKKEISSTKKANKAAVKPQNNVVSINTSGFSDAQIQDIRQLVMDIRSENSKNSQLTNIKPGQIYYTISAEGTTVEETLATGSTYDKFNIATGNAFTTKHAAKVALEKHMVRVELERFAKKHNGAFIPGKYYYIFMENYKGNTILNVSEYSEKVQGAVLFSSDTVAEFAIKSIGIEKIKKLFY